MTVITKRTSYRLRRFTVAGMSLGVLAAALVALPSSATAATPPPYGTTWVTSQSGNSVTELSPSGAVVGSPVKGGNTGLSDPQGVVADKAGNIFVANFGSDSITEYADGASGNVAPIATISGSQTGLSGPTGLSLEGSALWVTDSTTNTLEEFTAGGDGNVLPYQTIYGSRTKLDNPVGLFVTGPEFDAALSVVNDPSGRPASIEQFDPSSGGNRKPESRITGSKTQLSDPRAVVMVIGRNVDRVDVANAGSNTITEYDAFGPTDQKPAAVLSGSATKLHGPTAIGLDAVGRLSVANAADGAVHVFKAGAHGDAAPTRSATGPADPGGAAVLAATPGVPTSVSGTAENHAVHLTWKAPADNGGGILGYAIIIEQHFKNGGSEESFGEPFQTAATHITERHLKNGGKYEFRIAAVNEVGVSGFSKGAHASPATVPGSPRAVTLTPHTDSLAVAWKAPKHDGGRTIRHYVVRYATCTIGAKGCHAPSITVKGSRRSLTLHGLSGGTSYHVEVTAKNHEGPSAPSKPVTGTPRN